MFFSVSALFLAGLYREVKCFFADCIYISSLQSFNLAAIGCLQWSKHCDVTGLELMGGVGGDTAKNDVAFETEL
jgi:hypothetical protein